MSPIQADQVINFSPFSGSDNRSIFEGRISGRMHDLPFCGFYNLKRNSLKKLSKGGKGGRGFCGKISFYLLENQVTHYQGNIPPARQSHYFSGCAGRRKGRGKKYTRVDKYTHMYIYLRPYSFLIKSVRSSRPASINSSSEKPFCFRASPIFSRACMAITS